MYPCSLSSFDVNKGMKFKELINCNRDYFNKVIINSIDYIWKVSLHLQVIGPMSAVI